jgi:hypothetical protein
MQKAVADFPEVIAGLTTEGDAIKPLVLVAREISIPSTGFNLDHLFLDDEGIPVLVEVKRASDTRIRREVVGRMLDYAADLRRANVVPSRAIQAVARQRPRGWSER